MEEIVLKIQEILCQLCKRNGFLEPSPSAETAVVLISGQIHDGYNLKE